MKYKAEYIKQKLSQAHLAFQYRDYQKVLEICEGIDPNNLDQFDLKMIELARSYTSPLDKHEALEFLREHQPMPPDSELTEELITKYDVVREYFISHPDPECIPLFLNSFGEGSGFGVYQLVGDVLRQYAPKEVVPHLVKALRSPYRSVREWSAQLAMEFPEPELIKPLEDILFNYDEDPEIRSWAAMSISFIDDPLVDNILEQALRCEQNPKVRNYISEAIKKRPGALAATRREQAGKKGDKWEEGSIN